MELIKKNSGKKGFTLVEIIVVLVVLAILAAFIIPTMLGFVADAKGKAYIAEAREVYVAAQAVATEYSGLLQMTDSDPYEWYGLTNCLGSTKIATRRDYDLKDPKTDPVIIRDYYTPRVQSSLQMYRYLGNDITISKLDPMNAANITKLSAGESAWTVTVGTDPDRHDTKTAKVTKVVYYKNHYKVTIEENSATVEKY
ncbi:prepilin-type N-terminal cleavage/methylation domain-containing protein [Acetobacterium wieringae]|uniref:Type II secretion system protein G n=1 Tax=Acetobacterium wieringae TaxID=52694 RepID=A0A1F2PHH0_9FIRM|nr:prepilin-type N-terminal cleavage/methylation domain-containing protein [Acetobacterium wieringae]OFV70166.1 hypothetical protein ACWI_23710 [Acetobacterium wieringae]